MSAHAHYKMSGFSFKDDFGLPLDLASDWIDFDDISFTD